MFKPNCELVIVDKITGELHREAVTKKYPDDISILTRLTENHEITIETPERIMPITHEDLPLFEELVKTSTDLTVDGVFTLFNIREFSEVGKIIVDVIGTYAKEEEEVVLEWLDDVGIGSEHIGIINIPAVIIELLTYDDLVILPAGYFFTPRYLNNLKKENN